jgi:hypothetical protein
MNFETDVTYVVAVHDKYSYNKHKQYIKTLNYYKNINCVYVCGINPDKTDIYPNDDIINIYDKNDIHCIPNNNKRIRFASRILYILKHPQLFNTPYILLTTCTTYYQFLDLDKGFDDNVLFYTHINHGNYLGINDEQNMYINSTLYNIFGIEKLFDPCKIYTMSYILYKRFDSELLYNLMNDFYVKMYQNPKLNIMCEQEILHTSMCNYLSHKNCKSIQRSRVNHFKYDSERRLHIYGKWS